MALDNEVPASLPGLLFSFEIESGTTENFPFTRHPCIVRILACPDKQRAFHELALDPSLEENLH